MVSKITPEKISMGRLSSTKPSIQHRLTAVYTNLSRVLGRDTTFLALTQAGAAAEVVLATTAGTMTVVPAEAADAVVDAVVDVAVMVGQIEVPAAHNEAVAAMTVVVVMTVAAEAIPAGMAVPSRLQIRRIWDP